MKKDLKRIVKIVFYNFVICHLSFVIFPEPGNGSRMGMVRHAPKLPTSTAGLMVTACAFIAFGHGTPCPYAAYCLLPA